MSPFKKPGATWGGGGNDSCFEMVAVPLLVIFAAVLHVFGG
jgi:hypothetical protein